MAWTDPATWVDGTVVTAAALNLHLRDNLRYLYAGGGRSGTSFPGSPATGDRVFRTDLGYLCYWDGTRWLTCHEYQATLTHYVRTAIPFAAATTVVLIPLPGDYQIYVTRAKLYADVATTNNGSNYWTMTLKPLGGASIWAPNTSADAIGTPLYKETALTSVVNANAMVVDTTLTGAPGTLALNVSFWYRKIVT